MSLLTPFIVLIERRRWRNALAVVLAMLVAAMGLQPVHARPFGGDRHHKDHKVSRDLDDEMVETRKPKARWARDVNGVRHIQAIIVSDSPDPEMTDLRAHVQRIGGTVLAAHPAVHAITVQIKARQVKALSERDDVVSVSPNRDTQRTASTLESITGALTSGVRTSSTKTSYSGLDGTGVGIAVLDSGVMREHWAFADANAGYRIKRNVNMLNNSVTEWVTPTGGAGSRMPGSTALATYESAIAADTAEIQDAFGHGTHVASVAAGRAKF